MTNEGSSIALLVNDLNWQIDQLSRRGIKNSSGNPYNPSYYKRGLQNAVWAGGTTVADFVLRYVYKSPSDGFRKLEVADSLDLACEALVADETKPYAALFSDADRAAARKRLAPFIRSIEERKAASQARIEAQDSALPGDIEALRALAMETTDSEQSAAINLAILRIDANDVVALNRLGRAYEATGAIEQALESFEGVLVLDPANVIAKRRIREIKHRREG